MARNPRLRRVRYTDLLRLAHRSGIYDQPLKESLAQWWQETCAARFNHPNDEALAFEQLAEAVKDLVPRTAEASR